MADEKEREMYIAMLDTISLAQAGGKRQLIPQTIQPEVEEIEEEAEAEEEPSGG